jgi:hypothetical protein
LGRVQCGHSFHERRSARNDRSNYTRFLAMLEGLPFFWREWRPPVFCFFLLFPIIFNIASDNAESEAGRQKSLWKVSCSSLTNSTNGGNGRFVSFEALTLSPLDMNALARLAMSSFHVVT